MHIETKKKQFSKKNKSAQKQENSKCPSFLLNSPKHLKNETNSIRVIKSKQVVQPQKLANKCWSTHSELLDSLNSQTESDRSFNYKYQSQHTYSDHQSSFYSIKDIFGNKSQKLEDLKVRKQSYGGQLTYNFESTTKQGNSEESGYQQQKKNCLKTPMMKSLFIRNNYKSDKGLQTNKFKSAKNIPPQNKKNGPTIQQPLKIDNFYIIRKLGEGATASVYLVSHKATNTIYALKAIKKSYIDDSHVKESLIRQIKNTLKIKDSNVVKLYSVFDDEEHIYLLMEYLTDGSLYDKWQENNKQLPEKAVAKLIGDVCRGLKTLHKSEIIHRDIKLQNVLVEKNVAKIGDLGCSVETLVLRKTRIGSPCYFSPQQLSNHLYSSKIDMWSVGIMTFQLLFGYSPYEKDIYQIFVNKDKNHILPNFEIPEQPAVSQVAKDFIGKVLQKKVGNRMSADEALNHPFLSNYMDEIKLVLKTA